jgi:thiamine kinase-like enzyme
MTIDHTARVAALPIWRGKVDPVPLGGGMTNQNFTVQDANRRYVVRVGADVPEHGLMRFAEQAASRAAARAGISPEVIHHEPGLLVLDFIEGRTLTPEDVQQRAMQQRIVPLLKRAHKDVPRHLRGAALAFWVFHVLRDYGHTLAEAGHRLAPRLGEWARAASRLEARIGPIDLVFGHNDLLAANLIDDGKKLWLVDWDYGGFNSPLFDLGGVASNSELAEDDRLFLLEAYFDRPVDDAILLQSQAMLTASLLREAMWSMVSELYSTIEMDFVAYTTVNLRRFDVAWRTFEAMDRA